jgi:hypothetical protein
MEFKVNMYPIRKIKTLSALHIQKKKSMHFVQTT